MGSRKLTRGERNCAWIERFCRIPEGKDVGKPVVPAGSKVITDYVPIEQVVLACRDRMDIAAVEKAMQRRMSCAPNAPWPCPVGEWRADRMWIFDGRHEAIGAIMLGCSHILVAWIEAEMTDKNWLSVQTFGSAYEEELDVSRPNGEYRHRKRGEDKWIPGRAPR